MSIKSYISPILTLQAFLFLCSVVHGKELTITENVAPEISISAPSNASVNIYSDHVSYTITYTNASVITLNNDDISLNTTGNVTASFTITGTGNTRTITFAHQGTNPLGQGTGTLGFTIAAGSAEDDTGAPAPSVTSSTYIIDLQPPTVSISPVTTAVTTNSSIQMRVTYYGADNINLGVNFLNINSKTGSASFGSYEIEVDPENPDARIVTLNNPSGGGIIEFIVIEGSASDNAGNYVLEHTIFEITVLSADLGDPRSKIASDVLYIPADGTTQANLTVSLVDADGNPMSKYSGEVELSAKSSDVLSSTVTFSPAGTQQGKTIATYENVGHTYSASISNTAVELITLSFTLDGEISYYPLNIYFYDPAVGPPDPLGVVIGPPSVTETISGPIQFEVTITGATSINMDANNVAISVDTSPNNFVLTEGQGTVENHPTDPDKRIVTLNNFGGEGTIRLHIFSSDSYNNFIATGYLGEVLEGNWESDPITVISDIDYDNANTRLIANPQLLIADGVTNTTITLEAADATGTLISHPPGRVSFEVYSGSELSETTIRTGNIYNNDYTVSFRFRNTVSEVVTVRAYLNGHLIANSVNVQFSQFIASPNLEQSSVLTQSVSGPLLANGTSEALITVILRDVQGNPYPRSGGTIALNSTGSGIIGNVIDNQDGSYNAHIVNNTAETVTISATLNGEPLTSTSSIVFGSLDQTDVKGKITILNASHATGYPSNFYDVQVSFEDETSKYTISDLKYGMQVIDQNFRFYEVIQTSIGGDDSMLLLKDNYESDQTPFGQGVIYYSSSRGFPRMVVGISAQLETFIKSWISRAIDREMQKIRTRN